MGQRHQAFVIARARPYSSSVAKYRCIAAFHHQWCYGRLPLHATHRFITQAKKKFNAEIIRSEIAAIQGKFGRWREEPALPAIPCPFTAFLLATNWSVDLEDPKAPYASGVSFSNGMLEADMGSAEGGEYNNDGISVIDVTDPEIPSYCFVSVLGIEADPVPYRVPLSAEEYVRAYYPKYVPPVKAEAEETEEMTTQHRHSLAVEEDVQVTIAKLKDVKLVEPWMLAEAWSAEYKEVSGNTEKAPEAVMEPVKSEIPSLVDLTIPLLAAHAIPSGETADIEAMVWMPDKRSAIKAVLRQLSPFPEGGMSLLKKVIGQELEKHNAQLDLSGFALSSAQLEALIPAMSIDVVNLSDMPAVTIDAVRHILTKLPQLKRLILFECPSISSDDIYSLLGAEPGLFNRLDALIHPCLFGELKDTEDLCPYHNAFSYIGAHSRGLKACSLPFFTPSRVIQALIDILGPLCDEYGAYSFWTTSLAMQAAFSSVRAHGQKWSERDTVIIPQLSLRALKGEGWTFAIRTDLYNEDNRAFAFIRIKSDPPTMGDEELHKIKGMEGSDAISAPMNASAWEIHDLASFVNQVTLDGKPRPTDDAVNELQKILTTLQTTQNMPLMGDQDVPRFFGDVKKAIGHLY